MTRPLPEIPRYPLLTLTRHAIQTALPSGMFSESDLGLLPGDGAARLWGGAGCVCVCVWKRVLSAMAELHSCQRDPQAGLWSGCPGHGERIQFSSLKQIWLKTGRGTDFSKDDREMAEKYIKRCSAPLIIRGTHIKTTMSPHHG